MKKLNVHFNFNTDKILEDLVYLPDKLKTIKKFYCVDVLEKKGGFEKGKRLFLFKINALEFYVWCIQADCKATYEEMTLYD